MKRVSVTLLVEVKGLGKKGDIVQCSPGYARNALLGRGKGRLAVAADEHAVRERSATRQKDIERHRAEEERVRKSLEGCMVTIAARANDQGALYGSVGASPIAAALAANGKRGVTNDLVTITTPITTLGEHRVTIAIGGKTASVTVRVVAQ